MSATDVELQVTDSDLFKATGDFLSSLFPAVEVLQSQQNQTSMSKGGFITMTPLFLTDLSTNSITYEYDGVSEYGKEHLRRVDEWQCQLDFYGKQAQNNATIFSRVVRSEFACTWFRENANVLVPLYSGPPRQTTMINGENQWESRWMLEFHANPLTVVSVPQQFMTGANVISEPVDVRFPPEKK
ncbi:phage neck terminator protein [Klebsiella aerogenes]|uniref:phage neck terminator protein n=1 Tax=Klebsiella aerogenes TaxID=548 RepID=UPI00186815AC|nr:hypothetical protein [Klebsiella aerogenes]